MIAMHRYSICIHLHLTCLTFVEEAFLLAFCCKGKQLCIPRLSLLSVRCVAALQSLVAPTAWCEPSGRCSSSPRSTSLPPQVWGRSFPSQPSFTSSLPELHKKCDHLTRQVYHTLRLPHYFLFICLLFGG